MVKSVYSQQFDFNILSVHMCFHITCTVEVNVVFCLRHNGFLTSFPAKYRIKKKRCLCLIVTYRNSWTLKFLGQVQNFKVPDIGDNCQKNAWKIITTVPSSQEMKVSV